MKLRGANYDESMIEFKLREKKFPLEIASRYSKDFLILTNGIPLFVEMISQWTLRIKNPEILKVFTINNNEVDEENQNLKENTLNFSDDRIFAEINKEIDRLVNDLSRQIESYIDDKVNKFKTERYDKFDEIMQKNSKTFCFH